ncbi:MAG: hydantoinase/oxoprolinase family protein, partial [Candidatus Thorarchaeota archaeon]
MSFGGGGPLHVAGYSRGLDFQEILIPEWAPAFSAFGCACAEYSYRHEKTMDLIMPPDGGMNTFVASMLNSTWSELKSNIAKEFEKEGRDHSEIEFRASVRLQYLGMFDDLEVQSPTEELSIMFNDDLQRYDSSDLIEITRRYNKLFEQIFRRGTTSPELGYHITKAIVTGVLPVPKPRLPEQKSSGDKPDDDASKGNRDIFWNKNWHEASLWEMNQLKPGNIIKGPAVIEAPATTLVVPPGFQVKLDKHRIFHMEV